MEVQKKKCIYIYIFIHTVLDLPGIKLYTINHIFFCKKKDTFFRVLNVLHFQTHPFLVVSDLLISEFLWGTEDLCGGLLQNQRFARRVGVCWQNWGGTRNLQLDCKDVPFNYSESSSSLDVQVMFTSQGLFAT